MADRMVLFADLDQAEPIYHRWQAAEHDPDVEWRLPQDASPRNGRYIGRTPCGLVFWREGPGPWVMDQVPRRHAEKFGRPCERCWPELFRNQGEDEQ